MIGARPRCDCLEKFSNLPLLSNIAISFGELPFPSEIYYNFHLYINGIALRFVSHLFQILYKLQRSNCISAIHFGLIIIIIIKTAITIQEVVEI